MEKNIWAILNKYLVAAVVTLVFSGIASQAQASIMEYDFSVSGNWWNKTLICPYGCYTDIYSHPYGLPLSPVLNGTITVDNTLPGSSAIVVFSLTTGTKTWTLADFVAGTSSDSATFDTNGNLTDFKIWNFQSDGGYMYVATNNMFNVWDKPTYPYTQGNACNNCVHLGSGTLVPIVVLPVPEPETYAMMLVGLGLLGVTARRRKGKQQ
ncbi:MAG: PEP-CTERM sorting domain-containing protein [Sideroxyarcus sp.]